MARAYECSKCEHVQVVGVIDNGFPAGYADPRAVCENCGTTGSFRFAPGWIASTRNQIARALARHTSRGRSDA